MPDSEGKGFLEHNVVKEGKKGNIVQPEDNNVYKDKAERAVIAASNKSPGGNYQMTDSSSSKTPAASLQERMGKIYEQSRTYWDSTVKKEDPIDLKKQDLGILKAFAYSKLGEEIMKQTDLSKYLGRNGTEIQLTEIRDGELYAFEKGGQLHITSKKDDIDANKVISLNDAVGRIDRGGINKVKWHLPMVYAIKLEKSPKEDPKVLITDNEDLFKNCKEFIESRAKGPAPKVLIADGKEFFDEDLKQDIKEGNRKSLQLKPGGESGVDLSGTLDSDRAKNNVVVKSADVKDDSANTKDDWVIFAGQTEKRKLGHKKQVSEQAPGNTDHERETSKPEAPKNPEEKVVESDKSAQNNRKEVKQTDGGREHDVLEENGIDYPIYAILKVAHPDLEKSQMEEWVKNTREDLIGSDLAKKGEMLDMDNNQVRQHIVSSLRTQEIIDSKRGVRMYMYDNKDDLTYKDVEGDNVSGNLPYEVFLPPKKNQEVEGVAKKEPLVKGLGKLLNEQNSLKTSAMTSTGEVLQIPGKRVHNVSPDGMNCLIRALVRSHGHDPEAPEIEKVVERTREALITYGLARKGEMLDLGDEQGAFVIQYLRSIGKIDEGRGVCVYTYGSQGELRATNVVESIPGNSPYELFLMNHHFQAVIDDTNG